MGVIRKKTATRGGEGGVKYVCDVCSADITSTVRPVVLVMLSLRPASFFLLGRGVCAPPHVLCFDFER